MTHPRESSHETRTVDALIVAALRADLDTSTPDLDALPPALTDEDRSALATLPPNFIMRLLASPKKTERLQHTTETERRKLATAMNRSGEDAELTDAARKEMARRISEAEQDTQGKPRNANGS